MDDGDIIRHIDIDEANYKDISDVGGYETVTFLNLSNSEIDIKSLLNHFIGIKGTDKVKHLRVSWTSKQEDIEIVKAFPCLRTLLVGGKNIKTLDGLEWFKGGLLFIRTEGKHKRNIEKIAYVPIPSIKLDYSHKEDYDIIGKCTSLERLEVYKGPSPDFSKWRSVPLEYIKFMQGKFTELCDIGHLKELGGISVAGCRKFEKFVGVSPSVNRVDILGCKHYDVSSLSSFPNVKHVLIHDSSPGFALSELPELSSVRILELWACNVNIDTYEIKKKMPKLEKISISKLKKDQEQLLRDANPGLEVK